MTMKYSSTVISIYPTCDKQIDDEDDDDDDDDKSVMLEDLDTYQEGDYKESLRQQTDDKHEQDEDDESDLSDDEYEGDEDDDDDKSVMLEDLEQSHTKYYYNKAVQRYRELKEQQARIGSPSLMATRRDCFVKDASQPSYHHFHHHHHHNIRGLDDDDDDKSVMLEDLDRPRVIPSFVDIQPRDSSDDDCDDDSDDDSKDNNSDEPFIPEVVNNFCDDDYSPPGKHKTHRRGNHRKSLLKTPKRRTRRRTPQLWVFLLNSLLNPELNPSIIEWKDKKKGVFKLKNTKKIAQIWGQRIRKDHKKPMDYEKFSRAIRYYYHKRVIMSVPGRLTYQFGPKATGWKRAVQDTNS